MARFILGICNSHLFEFAYVNDCCEQMLQHEGNCVSLHMYVALM